MIIYCNFGFCSFGCSEIWFWLFWLLSLVGMLSGLLCVVRLWGWVWLADVWLTDKGWLVVPWHGWRCWLGFLLSQHQISLVGCLFYLAGLTFGPTGNWLPNLLLAGNPVTRIPDFVQPCLTSSCALVILEVHTLIQFILFLSNSHLDFSQKTRSWLCFHPITITITITTTSQERHLKVT